MISQFLAALSAAGLDVSAEEAADALWLASHMGQSAAIGTAREEPQPVRHHGPTDPELPRIRVPQKGTTRAPRSAGKDRNLYFPPAMGSEAGVGSHHGRYFQSPGVPALPGALAIARALRPLKRRVPSHTHFSFDEDATVERIAAGGPRVPVLKPSSERCFELALVVDQAPTLALWRQTLAELRLLLERHGAFRDVRVWGLNTDGGRVGLQAEWGGGGRTSGIRSPRELVDPAGRRLVLVVSDFVSAAWYGEKVAADALAIWARSGPLALVQVLPSRLWPRTGLAMTQETSLAALLPGVPNHRLRISDGRGRWRALQAGELVIPVLTLESRAVARWSSMVAGMAGARMPGQRFEIPVASPIGLEEVSAMSDGDEEAPQPTAAERVRDFRAGASSIARRLAAYLAAAPLSLPVMRLVQAVMLPESRQVHLAEVFLGGLLKQMTTEGLVGPEEVQYEFEDGVRDLLLNELRRHETLQVLEEVSAWLEQQTGVKYGFTAVLEGQGPLEDLVADDFGRPFAKVCASVLRRLGGEYSSAAERIETELEEAGNSRALAGQPRPIPYDGSQTAEEGIFGRADELGGVGRLKEKSHGVGMSARTSADWERKQSTFGGIQPSDSVGGLHALLIGINDYSRLPDGSQYPSLKGAVNDVSRMAHLLRDRYGLKPEKTRLLLSQVGPDGTPTEPPVRLPTYMNIVAAFKQLAAEANPGDRIYIHYSGHGTRGPTDYPEIKGVSAQDTALVPCDIGDSHSRYLHDLELTTLIQLLVDRGLLVTVVLDCSHAGGALRSQSIRASGRAVPRDVPWIQREPMPTAVADRQELLKVWSSQREQSAVRGLTLTQSSLLPVEHCTLFAACRPDEMAYELVENGEPQGALSYWLLDTLTRSADKLTCGEIHQRLVARIRGHFTRQTPMFFGNRERTFLAGDENIQVPTATTERPGNRPRIFLAGQEGVRLRAAITEGPMVLRVGEEGRVLVEVGLATGSKAGDRLLLKGSAELVIDQVGATESWAKVTRVLGPRQIEPGARAELIRRKTRVLLVAPERKSSPAMRGLARLRQALQQAAGSALVEASEDNASPDLYVSIDENDYFQIQDPGGFPYANLSPLQVAAPGAIPQLIRRLDHLARFRDILLMENPDPPDWLEIALEIREDSLENNRMQITSGAVDLVAGDPLNIRIVNRSSLRLDFVVLDLAPDYSVTQLLPPRRGLSSLPLDPDEGYEMRITGWLPSGYSEGKDVLKVIATRHALSFRWLELPALGRPIRVSARGGNPKSSSEPVTAPRPTGQAPTRTGLKPSDFPELEWITAQVEIRVRRVDVDGTATPRPPSSLR